MPLRRVNERVRKSLKTQTLTKMERKSGTEGWSKVSSRLDDCQHADNVSFTMKGEH